MPSLRIRSWVVAAVIALDTNVLVRYFVEDDDEQAARAAALIDSAIDRGEQLFPQSAGVAEDLVEHGLAGSSVLLAFPPGLDFVKAFFGCLLAGARAVPVPLPNPSSKNHLGLLSVR